jgi:ribosome-binding protein aMBF1 (putative translation factor)
MKNEMEKTLKARDILAQRFGEEGSAEREMFREEAYSFYFGEIIKNRRRELHMSQETLAQLVGKKRPYISRVENGEDLRLSNFVVLANALGLSLKISVEK